MSNDIKTVNIKDSILNEPKEITIKTFFGHGITVIEENGDYMVKSTGIKGLVEKILWFIYAPTLRSRRVVVKESLENNNATVLDEENKSKDQNGQNLEQIGNSRNSQFRIGNSNEKKTFDDQVNSAIEQAKNSFGLLDEECTEIRKRINTYIQNGLEDHSIVEETINQFVTEKFEKQDENVNINNEGSIKSGSKINESRNKIINVDNEFFLFNNENNNINSGDGKNSAINYANNMAYDNFGLSEQELKDLDEEIKGLGLQENEVQSYKENRIAEIKKGKKEKAEEQQQLERIAEQSKLENKSIEKRYKEAENNLKKIIPEGYRVTSSERGDKIKGDGNCFYRAIAKLENGDQEGYGKIRKTISDEISKSAELAEKSDDKIDDNLLIFLQTFVGEYNEFKDVEVAKNNLPNVFYQIKEHVVGEDKKNEYAGPIEAYSYAKATKKVVIIYNSNNQINVFIPDKDGNNVKVEHKGPNEIGNYIKKNNIDIANAVKLVYNAAGKHYEAIVPNVKN